MWNKKKLSVDSYQLTVIINFWLVVSEGTKMKPLQGSH